MAKKRAKKSKQQKRQEASARKSQKRSEQTGQQQVQEAPVAAETPRPMASLTPGDRLNLTLDEIGRRLNTNLFAARGVALVIDFVLCGILATIPLVTVFNAVSEGRGSLTTLEDLLGAGMSMGALAGVIAASLLFSFVYYVIIPFKLLPGKTPGKYLIGLKIVMVDGSPATLGALTLRWAFMTLFETLFTFASALMMQYVLLFAGGTASNVYNMVGAAISLVSVWFVWHNVPQRRALHDLVAGTRVCLDDGKN